MWIWVGYPLMMLVGFVCCYWWMQKQKPERVETNQEELQESMTLLDQSKAAHLMVGDDLYIRPTRNRLADQLFESDLAGKPFPDLVAKDNPADQVFVSEILREFLSTSAPSTRNALRDLLPKRTTVNNRVIGIEYNGVMLGERGAVAVTAKDETKESELQKQLDAEQKLLKFVAKAAVERSSIIRIIDQYRQFCQLELHDICYGVATPMQKCQQLFQEFHTFKGTFAQYQFVFIPSKLHELENRLSDLMKKTDPHLIENFFSELIANSTYQLISDDVELIRSRVGEGYFLYSKAIPVEPHKITELETIMTGHLDEGKANQMIQELRRLYYKPFSELLIPYVETVATLASRLGKSVEPLSIVGLDRLVHHEYFDPFAQSLVHVFRNAVDHGVETMEKRISAGKDPFANIECYLEVTEQTVKLVISDDGRGIDTEKLKRKAVTVGVLSQDEADQLSIPEAMSLIFHPTLSTKNEVTEYSGRGVGLSAVKTIVDELGGTIKVVSEQSKGTVFSFEIPYQQSIQI